MKAADATAPSGLILLDRDGVLNAVVVDPEHGTIDSPLHERDVQILSGVPQALLRLNTAGFGLCVVSNQPAAAKGKTTLANLQAVHAAVLAGCEAAGARILSSHICWHRAEDGCACRKPKPGLLQAASAAHPAWCAGGVWMVGDGVTDVQAGKAVGARTAFLGPRKCDACKVFADRQLQPEIWASDLADFVNSLLLTPLAQG